MNHGGLSAPGHRLQWQAVLPIITGPASILPPASARGSVSGAGAGGAGQHSPDAISQSHRDSTASWGAGVERAGCWGCWAGPELPRNCQALLGPLGDMESQRAAPGATMCSVSLSSSPRVMGCQGAARALGLGTFLMSPNPSATLFYRGVHQGTV